MEADSVPYRASARGSRQARAAYDTLRCTFWWSSGVAWSTPTPHHPGAGSLTPAGSTVACACFMLLSCSPYADCTGASRCGARGYAPALEPKSGVEHSGNNSGGEPPGSETVDRCPRMCTRVFVSRRSVPHFRPPAVVQVLTVDERPSRASRRALVWSTLRGNELRQKVLWFPRKGARRRADFSDTGYEQCRASGKPCRRFSRQAVALQTEIGKMHALAGTLPWEPQHLLRPCVSTGEAAGDVQ